ncbi:MAG: hypothetical protein JWN02_2177, partial [Acidobacteria bacterium]|nr:hypothetical protein [Acidobacteriota bacterium]
MLVISHSSLDRADADAAFRRFLERGYVPAQIFLDHEPEGGFKAGSRWEEVLEARLKGCQALIVLCTKNWAKSKWCFAELMVAKTLGKAIFPVMLEPCELDVVSAAIQAVLVHQDGEAAWERLLTALGDHHLGPRDEFAWPPPGVDDPCPYPGLPAFEERHAGVYFGRETERQEVQEALRKMRTGGEGRFLMIVGASGSGKSSLLKAGVLPRLKHKTSDSEWLVLPTLRYGHAPNKQQTVFDQLAMNVAAQFPEGRAIDWQSLRDGIKSPDPKTAAAAFVDALNALLVAQRRPEATVVLPIDQFEELMAPSAGRTARDFLTFLQQVYSLPNGRLLGIGTLRSDQLDSYERQAYALAAPFLQPWRLGAFPRERLRDVIFKPAERAEVSITEELLDRLEKETPTAEA